MAEPSDKKHSATFNTLGPYQDVDIDGSYKDLLDQALSDPSVHNIAVTGVFGSGKSSVVKSYEERLLKDSPDAHHFAYISLAAYDFSSTGTETPGKFSDKAIKSNPGSTTDQSHSEENAEVTSYPVFQLEKKIINQLSAKRSVVPRNFCGSVIPTAESVQCQRAQVTRLIIAAVSILLIITSLGLALSNSEKLGLSSCAAIVLFLIAIVLAAAIIIAFMVGYKKAGYPKLIKTISLKELGTFELHDGVVSDSYFDQNLAFVLQLFEDRPENVYVFEDIDRQSQAEVFVHLKELNAEINEHIEQERTVRFIYCISDTVIKGYDRTKFFDIILPIVPKLDGYSSYGTLLSELGEDGIDVDEKFLRNIAMYLDDYRLLKNTINEYLVYIDRLQFNKHTELKKEQMIALIALKNLSPLTFCQLEQRQGPLYEHLSPLIQSDKNQEDDSKNGMFDRLKKELGYRNEADDNSPINASISYERLKNYLSYILDNDYLNPGYLFYMSYFDTSRLDQKDMYWLMQARNGVPNYSEQLVGPENIDGYISDFEYSKPEFLNVHLLDWMIKEGDAKANSREEVINCAKLVPEFLDLAIDCLPTFPELAFGIDEGYIKYISKLAKRKYALSLMASNQSDELIDKAKTDNGVLDDALTDYIGDNADSHCTLVATAYPKAINHYVKLMQRWGLRAKRINFTTGNSNALERISNEFLFLPTQGNCIEICNHFGIGINSQDCLDRIFSNSENILRKYFIARPFLFMDSYLQDETRVRCSQETLLAAINTPPADIESNNNISSIRAALLEKYEGRIDLISAICDKQTWGVIESRKLAPCNTRNITDALSAFGATDEWLSFVNDSPNVSIESNELTDEDLQVIRDKVPGENRIENSRYEVLVSAIKAPFIDQIPNPLDDSKVLCLFKHHLIKLNQNTLAVAREKLDQKTRVQFIGAYVDEYINCLNYDDWSDEISSVLELASISKTQQQHLVDRVQRPISIAHRSYSSTVLGMLLDKRMIADNDLAAMFQMFGRDADLNSHIINFGIRSPIDQLSKANVELSPMLEILKSPECNDQRRCELMRIISNQYSANDIKTCLSAVSANQLASAFLGKHPKRADLTGIELSIIQIFVNDGWLSIKNGDKLYLHIRKKS